MDEKKTAIVTGASRGIGRATAVEWAKAGYFVVINFKSNETAAAETLKRVQFASGAGINADGLFMLMGEEEWDSVINTTLKGFYNITKPVLREMVRRKCGSIVSVSSLSALMPNRGQANYAAAKAGLIETDMIKDAPVAEIKKMIPMARLGKPEEVANVIRFLCSNDASYMTGQVLGINGGIC